MFFIPTWMQMVRTSIRPCLFLLFVFNTRWLFDFKPCFNEKSQALLDERMMFFVFRFLPSPLSPPNLVLSLSSYLFHYATPASASASASASTGHVQYSTSMYNRYYVSHFFGLVWFGLV